MIGETVHVVQPDFNTGEKEAVLDVTNLQSAWFKPHGNSTCQ